MKLITRYSIIIFTDNKPGVLYRIADLFLRRKINIDSLTVSEIESKGLSRFTIVVNTDSHIIEKIVKQLYKIIEVIKVFEKTDEMLLYKEISLIKVSTKNPEQRKEVEDLCHLFSARIVFVGSAYLTIEKSGSEEEINTLYSLLKPFGIKEYVRSGRIALTKDDSINFGKFGNTIKDQSRVSGTIGMSKINTLQLVTNSSNGVISLANTIPSFPTAESIKNAAIEAIKLDKTDTDISAYGIDQLRHAIVTKMIRDNNIEASIEQVIVTHGSIESLISSIIGLLNPHDEIIVLTPDYASHITQTQIARQGSIPIFVPLTETSRGWKLDINKVEGAISLQTKAIVFCNPGNPTGKVYSYEELKQIAYIAKKYNLFIISDETYEYLVYDNKKHISIGSFKEISDQVISLYSVSKPYAMPGWRIGYLIANKRLITQILKIHGSIFTCPSAVSQYAALEALKGDQTMLATYKQSYEKKRGIVINSLRKCTKVDLVNPEGAYFAFIKIKSEIDDYDLMVTLLHEAKVAVVPGSAFGFGGESHVRLTYGVDEKSLYEGLQRFIYYIDKNM